MEFMEFPAETRQIALGASDFAAAGTHDARLFLKNPSDAILHVRVSTVAAYLSVLPGEIALGPGERQPILIRVDLDGARKAVKGGEAPAAPVRLAYQLLRPGQIQTNSDAPASAASGEIYVTLPYAVCPACGKTLEVPEGSGPVPETCPFCYERLRACPICGAPNSWLARRCVRDENHVIRASPDWSALGGGAAHTGNLTERVPAALARRWSFPSAAPSRRENALSWSAPVAAYGLVAAAAATNAGEAHVYAFDARNGAPLWDAFPLTDPVYPDRGGVALAGGRLFAATVEGVCVAIDALRGTRIWEQKLPGKIYGAVIPADADGPLLVPLATNDGGGIIVALDAANGEVLFHCSLSGPPDTAPAAGDKRLFAHDDKGGVACFSLANGNLLWRADAGTSFNAAPILADGMIFSATESGTVLSFDAATGTEIWQLAVTNVPFSGTPACDGTLLYLPAEDGLHLVSAAAGRAVRRYPVRLPVRSAPVVADGTLLFGCMDGTIYGAAAGRGLEKLYETGAAGSQIIAAPALSDGAFFVAATNGVLYALAFPVNDQTNNDRANKEGGVGA